MAKRITSGETNVWLKDYFRRRRDTGFWKAVANIALYPPNPFKTEARRLTRPGFLIAAGLFASAVGWFLYFNLAR